VGLRLSSNFLSRAPSKRIRDQFPSGFNILIFRLIPLVVEQTLTLRMKGQISSIKVSTHSTTQKSPWKTWLKKTKAGEQFNLVLAKRATLHLTKDLRRTQLS